MVSLRTSTAACRLLRTATTTRSFATSAPRRRDTTSLAEQNTPTAVTPAPAPASQPDYRAPVDKATSTFTPVPKHVQDGSADADHLPGGLISGTPMELQARTVRIYQPSKPATQSGNWHSHHWRMDWDVLAKGHRWENPLMGWQSSGDMMQGTHIKFKSKEDAIAFAEKQDYEYFVQEPNQRRFTPKAYANNFLYSAKKLKHIRTK
ncbi:hypothetical protein MKZ38_004054 [Zalerion maritima]|uniref:NADH dehydrogenase [ubiquinone] iron-sulfur protein 4, mitochondrial n=1 Tax=Zalerion maritima TaxID=339359 RepID=A0AAD5WRB8_9PEZI|nr:hypothetical protein MKZ38_004054 [Zalerion maritima]